LEIRYGGSYGLMQRIASTVPKVPPEQRLI